MPPIATAAVTGLALSADAVAVALCLGAAAPAGRAWRTALAAALTFGAFQAVMPLLGWLGGDALRDSVASVDHWIAFALLAVVGGKMAWEGWRGGDDGDDRPQGAGWRTLLLLGVATSIDALAVGVGFAFIDVPLALTVAVIGGVTFACCLPAGLLGRRLGTAAGRPVQVIGGLVLVGLGVKIAVTG